MTEVPENCQEKQPYEKRVSAILEHQIAGLNQLNVK
jgi:hypothetical protein